MAGPTRGINRKPAHWCHKSHETILERLQGAKSRPAFICANTNDAAIAKHHQSVREVGAEIGAALLFVELELAKIEEGHGSSIKS